jgi:integrase
MLGFYPIFCSYGSTRVHPRPGIDRDMNRVRQRIRAEKRLRASKLAKLPLGTHEDGGGLRLVVEPNGEDGKPGSRRWVLRVTINGKRRNRGLGPFPLVTIDKAREQATDIRRAAREGRDLIRELQQQRAKMVTFRQAFDAYYELRKKTLSNRKHKQQWTSTMETYVYPKIGDLPVANVTHADVLAILEPIWFEKAETARRVLQRMELVFKSTIVLGQREKASPCVGIRQQLGIQHVDVEHLRALPYADVPAFLSALRMCNSEQVTRLAFEWLILTATRSAETRGARWEEINRRQALWTIPKERMKGRRTKRREHVVPLPERCLEILEQARALNPRSDLLFPGPRTGAELSDMTLTKVLRDLQIAERATVHGFRSSFRDWATEVDKAREVVAEAALAHNVKDKTESAYRRAVYLDERRGLMERWATYCHPQVQQADCEDSCGRPKFHGPGVPPTQPSPSRPPGPIALSPRPTRLRKRRTRTSPRVEPESIVLRMRQGDEP